MTGEALVSYLKVVSLLGSMLMVLQLYRTGLHLRYPIFFAYFIFRIPNSIWPFFAGVSTGVYQRVWVLTEPVEMVFYARVDGGGTLPVGSGEVQAGLVQFRAVGVISEPGDFGRHLSNYLVASD